MNYKQNNIQIFETNSGLGYNETAYFVKTNYNTFLCVSISFSDELNKIYEVGNIYDLIKDSDTELNPSSLKYLKESPLWNTFLFNEFISNLK